MIRAFLEALASSRRAQYAVLGNGLVSVASLALSVAIARTTTVAEFGSFAMAMVVFVFVSGLLRAAFTDTALARPNQPNAFVRSFRRASLASIVIVLGLLAWGFLSRDPYLIILAVASHGLLALDIIRTFDSAVRSARRSFFYSTLWAACTLAVALCSFVWNVSAVTLFIVWAGAGAICGYFAMALSRAPWMPGWPSQREETSAASMFALDYLVGSGGSALTTTLVGVVLDRSVVGAIRGAGTLLGPVNLIASTARSLTIPLLARAQEDPGKEFRLALRITLVLALVITPLLTVVQFIPPAWGEWLLGDTWAVAALALLPLAIESLFGLISSIPAAGHRAAFAGRRTLLLRMAVGIPRPFVVLASGLAWGVIGAVWAMALVAVINAIVWWVSYRGIAYGRENATA